MKKKILLACLVTVISTPSAYSYTGACNGGTIIENTAGTTFCKSNVQMNWWSAQAWCQVNGSRLATIYEMCPSWDGNTGSDKCPELKGKGDGYLWSATATDIYYAFYVLLSNGEVRYNVRSVKDDYSAFCR